MPWYPCPAPGCGAISRTRGPCHEHRTYRHRRLDATRGSATARGYGGDWESIRARHLTAEPTCRACRMGEVWALVAGAWQVERLAAGAGVETPATLVDHCIPLDDGGAHDWPADPATADQLACYLRACAARLAAADAKLYPGADPAPGQAPTGRHLQAGASTRAPGLPWCNLQSLCRACHARKSARERPRQPRAT